ncbi:OmpA family protein [uncultured Lacinutrix sp.]|uniref:OmpA family protein n=1 Tax=uncultured Lacinutrix sp. TaxID=574032 RepID=UPI002620A0EB|nr:OmpA family protein [uncultured Lacinutrix sp.]
MKHLKLIITLVILTSFSVTAQTKATKKADKHFAKFEFVEAIEDYTKLTEKGEADTYVYGRLAEANYNIFNTVEAEKWYAKALETSQEPEMLFKYSEMLKANGKDKEANAQMRNFAAIKPQDDRAVMFLANPDYLTKLQAKEEKFTAKNLDINSSASDFGGVIQDGKLYFSSARNNSRKKYGWNEEPFLDIYTSEVTSGDTYAEPELIGGKINTKYHEGITTFSPDGKTMYFSRESFFENLYEKDTLTNTKISVIHLFKATKSEVNKWEDIQPLSINNKDYSVKNPSVSLDGKTLYFASNMPGGSGLFDIYMAPIQDNGMVGTPVNLGKKVNTQGQEMFPYAGDGEYLYFSSNGHLGLGNLDVFYTNLSGTESVKNIGAPINSKADDFAFVINNDKDGYVSSNRAGGKGNDDIYAIKEIKPLCDVDMIVSVENVETGEKIPNATVTLHDDKGTVLDTATTNAQGIVNFKTDCEIETSLKITKEAFEDASQTVSGTKEETLNVSVDLTPIKKIIIEDRVVLEPIYFDFNKSDITVQGANELDKLILVMNKYPDMVIYATSHTDNRGKDGYNLRLSERRAQSTVAYVISKGINAERISGNGKGESEPLIDCKKSCTEEDHQLNRRSDFKIISGGPSTN